jgi:deoxyribonuclease-2
MLRLFTSLMMVSTSFALSCLSMDGEPTDSWTILKAPKTGDKYLFAEESLPLTQPSISLNETTNGALGKTLQQLWTTSDVSFLLYNDEPPLANSYNFTVGHAKGILALQEKTGFFILHSIPKFPLGPQETSSFSGLPSNAYTYGQNAICISISGDVADTLAYALHLVVPNIYESSLTDEVKINYPNITSLAQGKISTSPLCVNHNLQTVNGTPFTFFSKSTQWDNDLWYACVAQQLQTDLQVESWIRGSAIGPSCSDTYQVTDVQSVNFQDFSGFSWSSYDDHSKWATGNSWTCFGDINRMTSQYVRGGGAICVKNGNGIGYTLLNSIQSANSCS